MKQTIFLALLAMALCGCQTNDRIYVDDVEKIVAFQLARNQVIIDSTMVSMKQLAVDTIPSNVEYFKRLTSFHKEVVALCDTLDRLPKEKALTIINTFKTRTGMYHPEAPIYDPFKIDEDTPIPLIKMCLASIDNQFVEQQKNNYEYGMWPLRLGEVKPVIFLDQPSFKKGEFVTGEIVLAVTVQEFSTKNPGPKYQIFLNGEKVAIKKAAGIFQIKPPDGAKEMDLNARIVWGDSTLETVRTVRIEK